MDTRQDTEATTRGEQFDVDRNLSSYTNDSGRSFGASTVERLAARNNLASERQSSVDARVAQHLSQNQVMLPPERRVSQVPGALTGDQILSLYANDNGPSFKAEQDARLQQLQAQADRDALAQNQPELLSVFTRLVDDLASIRAANAWDYVQQVFAVLFSGERLLFLGIIMAVFGLVGMAIGHPQPVPAASATGFVQRA